MKQLTYRYSLTSDPYQIKSEMATHEYGDQWADAFRSVIERFPDRTVTFIDDENRVLGIGGIIPIRPGTEEAWTTLDDEAKSILMTPKIWKEALDMLQDKHRVRRMQAMASEEFAEELHGWLEYLGFEYECTHKEYDRGYDNHVYVRFMSWA